MKGNRKTIVAVIAVLVISVLGIGIAFAAFSRNLTINGNGTIQGSKWEIVFEGLNSEHPEELGLPTTVGTADVTTAPTIKSNSTEISSFVATLRSPGDSITYNFKIHNKGDYAASVTNVVINSGSNLSSGNVKAATINAIEYKFYYTDSLNDVGNDLEKDCLAPGESENVTLRLVFSSTNETDPNVLPDTDVLLDRLGITVNYAQESACSQGSSGGGSGSASGVVMSLGTPTVGYGGTSITAPTVSGASISGGEISIPDPGDSVTYPLTFTSSTARELTGVTIPTTADFVAVNPGVDSSVFDDIEIIVTDGNGTEVYASNRPCSKTNMLTSMNITLKHKSGTSSMSESIILPTMSAIFNEVSDCSSSTAGTYYIYEGKRFIGTGVNNLMIAENITDMFVDYATDFGTQNWEGDHIIYIFEDSPAADSAEAYCTGCRLMTVAEATAWGCPTDSIGDKCVGTYDNSNENWWLADAHDDESAYFVSYEGNISYSDVNHTTAGVRPVVSIPNGATMSGSGTSGSPYVISTSGN